MGKQDEYFRGLNAGLQLAYRLLKDSNNKRGADIVGDEIRKRGLMKIRSPKSIKEIDEDSMIIKQRMYETFLCQTLMTLRDLYGFGSERCLRFMSRWNWKTSCMEIGLVKWEDYVNAISEELHIDVPTKAMEEGKLI
jgi:hypothetical protein